MSTISLGAVRAGLVDAGITGPHQSHARRANIEKIRSLLDGDDEATFGIAGVDRYSPSEVLGFMSELTGSSPDIEDLEEQDTIDPDLTVNGIVAAAARLRAEAERGARLFVGTGHPTGLLEHNIRVADAYQAAGGKIVRPREGDRFPLGRASDAQVRYVGGVGCLSDWGTLKHTHRPGAMEKLLEDEPWPDIVFADHGFAGAAIERGIPTIAIMDINDHALAVAWGEKRDVTIVAMDDNRPPRLYEPAWRLFEALLDAAEIDD